MGWRGCLEDAGRMSDLTSPADYLDPKARSLYRDRGSDDPGIWNFCYPCRYKKRPKPGEPEWYLPVRWDGTNKLVIVAQQPSLIGDFPNRQDKLFWNAVVKAELANRWSPCNSLQLVRVFYEGPWTTNLVLKRAKVPDAENLNGWASSEWAEGFRAELQLVDPILVVAMGNKVFQTLRTLKWFDVPLERVTHHGYLARKNTQQQAMETLKAELYRVRKVYQWLQSRLRGAT